VQILETSYLPAPQAVHARIVGAPRYGETLPAGQATQSSTEPLYLTSRYVWYGHAEQALLFAGA
jgi:hypothetical protein